MPPTLGVDPRRVADVTLAAAVRAAADAVYIEPTPMNDETYVITLERAQQVLSTCSVDGVIGAATIARLAFIAGIDLAAGHSNSAVVPVRSGDREADVVVTIRPGDGLRADLMIVGKGKQKAAQPSVGLVGDVIGNYRIIEPLGEG